MWLHSREDGRELERSGLPARYDPRTKATSYYGPDRRPAVTVQAGGFLRRSKVVYRKDDGGAITFKGCKVHDRMPETE